VGYESASCGCTWLASRRVYNKSRGKKRSWEPSTYLRGLRLAKSFTLLVNAFNIFLRIPFFYLQVQKL